MWIDIEEWTLSVKIYVSHVQHPPESIDVKDTPTKQVDKMT